MIELHKFPLLSQDVFVPNDKAVELHRVPALLVAALVKLYPKPKLDLVAQLFQLRLVLVGTLDEREVEVRLRFVCE